MLLVRALLTWIVVFFALTLLSSLIGPLGVYEVGLVFAISVAVTVFAVRRWGR